MDDKELKRRVFGKMLEIHAGEMEKLTQAFARQVWQVNKMNRKELEQVNNELLHALHKKKTRIGLGTYFRSN